MGEKAEAVIVIHGLEVGEKDSTRAHVLKALEVVPERGRVIPKGSCGVAGVEGVRLEVHQVGHEHRVMDVYEAYWGDLVTRLSQQSLPIRMRRGLEMLLYWGLSRVWGRIWRYKWLTFNMLSIALVTLLWYYGVVALFLKDFGSNTSILQPVIGGLQSWMTSTSAQWGVKLEAWQPWLVASLLMGVLPVSMVVDISDFTRRYLQNELLSEGLGLRDHIRHRVLRVVQNICESGQYERVTIVAHSFGVVVAVDVLAGYESEARVPLRFITLAGPLEMLAQREDWVGLEIKKCAESPHLEQWFDFYSPEDWFGFPTPPAAAQDRLQPREVRHGVSFMDRLMGATHRRYFGHQEFVHTLLARERPVPSSRHAAGGAG
jgi:hypothetical protein